ncbi:Low-affinity iron/zinc ion transport protein fet4 [Diplogelasinospora grovesii]|uniref:Low-affinity iron/zinc ion transport protein fet4 n=1 Tax=Diplogelasinospora grovesii TaxID=303347 RepID=A0AAN6NJY4_9PEZI|nr:Low-affinity iron/zinc ion transport protein fet4 [Diplogelasinospora grovesii]
MTRIVEAIRAPGAKGEISDVAPTQLVTTSVVPGEKNITGFVIKAKDRLLDRCLDRVVRVSGSEPVFLTIVAGVLVWAFLGIRFGGLVDWAVSISDIQAIVSYIFDSFLMRQQLNEYERDVRVSVMLRSRNTSHKRMLREIVGSGRYDGMLTQTQLAELLQKDQSGTELLLPAENWIGRVSTFVSAILGHIITCGLYWVCIFIWIGFGQYCGWSDEWQLYINSSTSALMLLIFAFLANIQERHGAHIDKCLDALFQVDSAIEVKLRTVTGDTIPNPMVTIPAPKVGRIQRAIFYYADVVGTLVGIALLITVMTVWLAIGPVMSFNSNWWLLIGTYAGLIGMNDGFVLDNVQSRLHSYVDDAFAQVHFDDLGLFDDIGAPEQAEEQDRRLTISQRLSMRMGAVCSHPATVIVGVLSIVGLIIGASAMKWTTTGQLLCNIPPSIIESFFMIILITGHNLSDHKRRDDLQNMYLRRLKLLSWAKGLKLLEEV